MDNFNKEAFILEVEKRPVIWDTDCQEYSDRILKRKAWDELTEIFADPSYSKEKKSIFNMQLQRKWKNLRDTYIKEYKKVKGSSTSGALRSSNYIYYSRLSFLQKCLKNKLTTSSNDSKDMDVDQVAKAAELLNSMNDSLSELMETASTLEKSSNKSKTSELGRLSPHEFWLKDEMMDVVQPTFRTRKGSSSKRSNNKDDDKDNGKDNDNDKLFCLSLYKEIRKVPEHNRLDAKIELLRVLRTAQKSPIHEAQIFPQNVAVNSSSHWLNPFSIKRVSSSKPVIPELSIPTKPNRVQSYWMPRRVQPPSSSDSSLSSDSSMFNQAKKHFALPHD